MHGVRRRTPVRKVLGVVVGGVLSLAAAFWIWVDSVADRRWAAVEKRVAALAEEFAARDARRPVLRADPLPGNAWDDYLLAIDALKTPGFKSVLEPFIERRPEAERDRVAALVSGHAAALDHLQRGVRRAESRSPFRLRHPARIVHKDSPSLRSQDLILLAVCKARLLNEEGMQRDATRLLLDVCQLGHDIAWDADFVAAMVGMTAYSYASRELRPWLVGRSLPGDALNDLNRELEMIDEQFPEVGPLLTREVASVGAALVNGDFIDSWQRARVGFNNEPLPDSVFYTWRYAWSRRLMEADAFQLSDSWMRRAAAAETQSSSAVNAVWDEIRKEADSLTKDSRNPVLELMGMHSFSPSGTFREPHARLRLLRVAVHYRATGEILDLEDPMGLKLVHSLDGGRLRVWSAGRDGANDGGEGQWPSGGKDIVLEIER